MKTLYLEERENECYSRLERLVQKAGIINPMIFDVGANVGQSIAHFRETWPTSRIHSFEPNPSTYQRLQSTWGRCDGVTIQQLALSDHAGAVSFHATRVPEVASLLPPTKRLQQISTEHKYDFELVTVQADMLDSYCQDHDVRVIDILKIDVQGAELGVLKGAHSLLKQGAIRFIYLETTFAECYDGQTDFADLLSFMKSAGDGYTLWDIVPFLYTGRDRLWAANSILVSNALVPSLES